MTALPNYTPLIFGLLGAAMFQPAAMQASGSRNCEAKHGGQPQPIVCFAENMMWINND